MQIAGLQNIFTDIFHRSHKWCGTYCNYVTLPPEIGAIAGVLYVLKKNQLNLVGILLLCFPILFLLASVLLP